MPGDIFSGDMDNIFKNFGDEGEKSKTQENENAEKWEEITQRKFEPFTLGVEKTEQFYASTEKEKISMMLEGRFDQRVLEQVFGEGMPLDLTYHDFHNLTGLIVQQPISFESKRINSTISEKMGSEKLPQAIEAAKNLEEIYKTWANKIISRSEKLKQLLEPFNVNIDRHSLRKVALDEKYFQSACESLNLDWKIYRPQSEQELEDSEDPYIRKQGGYNDRRTQGGYNLGTYHGIVEPNFGNLFRSVAITELSKEEFEQYSQDIKNAIQGLIDAISGSKK